jgi:hypothetical protein
MFGIKRLEEFVNGLSTRLATLERTEKTRTTQLAQQVREFVDKKLEDIGDLAEKKIVNINGVDIASKDLVGRRILFYYRDGNEHLDSTVLDVSPEGDMVKVLTGLAPGGMRNREWIDSSDIEDVWDGASGSEPKPKGEDLPEQPEVPAKHVTWKVLAEANDVPDGRVLIGHAVLYRTEDGKLIKDTVIGSTEDGAYVLLKALDQFLPVEQVKSVWTKDMDVSGDNNPIIPRPTGYAKDKMVLMDARKAFDALLLLGEEGLALRAAEKAREERKQGEAEAEVSDAQDGEEAL